MQDSLKTLITILKSATEGQNIQIENVNIALVFAGEPLYFVMPSDEDDVWIRVNNDILTDFLNEETAKLFLDKIRERKNSMIVCENFFWENLSINGKIENGDSPVDSHKKVPIIVATKIKESSKATWKRGSVTLIGDQSYTEINQKLKERISGALQPYVGTSVFLFLNNEIMQQFKNHDKTNNKYLITECEQCGKLEVYHAFEIANKCCNPMLCRNCGKSKYKNLCVVPFSDTFLIDIFDGFTNFFDIMHKSQEPPKELTEKLLKYAKLDHHLEVGVVYEDLRNQYKKKFQKDNYLLMNKIKEIIE